MPATHTTPFEAFLLDLDGTLIDHFTAIHRCYAHTLPRLGLPAPTPAQVREAVGGGLENALLKFVPASRLAEAVPIYRAFWDRTMLDGVEAMPGATDLLRSLSARGCRLGVLTNKLGSSSRLICDKLGFTPFLAAVIGAGDTPWLKPAREFTLHALATLGAEPDRTLLVGDSPYDVEAALAVGMASWVVTTGTHGEAALQAAGAGRVFDGLPTLAAALTGADEAPASPPFRN